MVVKPPPSTFKKNKDIEDFINKGANVKEKLKGDWITTPLRIPKSLKEEIDLNRESRIGISRNAWVLEAIQEKLKK